MSVLEDIFVAADGLASLLPGFRFRPDQLRLSEQIARLISAGEHGLFEAGTGTGKTIAYLVPALLFNKTVIISTGTKNLQDQLHQRDIPLIQRLVPGKKIALLKGRSNYVCPYRLEMNLKVLRFDAARLSQLQEIRFWQIRSATGDLTEIINPEDDPRLLSLVSSTRDNCLSHKCPSFDRCPVYKAREKASNADLVVVNHHLLFADLALKEESLARLLPEAGAIICDEAHQIPGIARQFFGQRISSSQLYELTRDIKNELTILGNDDPATLMLVAGVEKALEMTELKFDGEEQREFNDWVSPEGKAAIRHLDDRLVSLRDQLQLVSIRSVFLARCYERCVSFADHFAMLSEKSASDGEYVHWIERHGKRFTLHLSPVNISSELRELRNAGVSSWIFTSATLTVNNSFHHFVGELGLGDVCQEQYGSPFDFAEQVRAYLPADLPLPGSADHTRRLVEEVRPLIDINPGKTFFLFTSHRALRLAAELMLDMDFPVLVQGEMTRSRLLERFRGEPHCILLATQSFWEGVDVSGADLKLLIIDKLPFPNPSDPLHNAQARIVESRGQRSFNELSLPQAILSLKQGFGRLVRQESDRGLFVIGDPRLQQRVYGGDIIRNLPPMQWLDDKVSAIAFLRQL